MRKMKKTLALLAIVAMVLTMVPMQVFAADSTRLAGPDRIATAIAIADAFGPADTVILAPADNRNLVDSLAVAPLAGKVSPVYLTFKNSLDAAVKAKLSGKKVIAIGAVSDAVIADAQTVATSVEKVSGADRIATSDLINAKLTAPAGTFVVGYYAIPDALSVASFAAANNYAIVIANPDGSFDASKIKGSKTYLLGGPTLVKDMAGVTATRLYGPDRFDTNVEVMKALTYSYDKVYLANGISLVDALAGAPLAAKTNSPILLTDNVTVKAASVVSTKMSVSSVVVALGGTGVVSDSVVAQVAYSSTTFEVESVSVIDANHLKVVFTQVVDETTASDTENYDFEGIGDADDLEIEEAEAEANIVTLTLDETTILGNDPDDDVSYAVEIIDVENTSDDVMVTYREVIELYDDVAPEVESVEMADRDTLAITFTEDVKGTGTIEILDDDGDEVDTDDIDIDEDDASIINVTGLGDEDEGDYTVTIEDVKDLAGNKIDDTEEDFELEEDESDPDVDSVKAISATTLRVNFDEAIDVPFDVLIDGVDEDDEITEVSGTSKKSFYVTVGDFDDGDSHEVTIVNYFDFAGNEGDEYNRFVRFDNEIGAEIEDTEATIKSYGGDRYAVFTYDMDVVGDVNFQDLDGSYVDEDDDDINVTIDLDDIYDADSLDNLDDDQIAIQLTPYDIGDYEVTLPEGFVTANDADSDEVDVTFSVTEEEEEDVVVDNVFMEEGDVVVVEFSDEVDGDSALDTDNYALDGDNIFDEAEFVNADKEAVRLTVGAGELDENVTTTVDPDADEIAFTVENIEDANGNDVEDFNSYDEGYVLDFTETEGPQVELVELTGINTIDVTFNEAIANPDDIDEDDFKVTVDGDEVEIDFVETLDNITWTLTLEDDLEDYDTVKAGTSADFDGEDADGNVGQASKLKTAE
jgi:putative cell wall-binding protein